MKIIKQIVPIALLMVFLLSSIAVLFGCAQSKEADDKVITNVSELDGRVIGCEEGAAFLDDLTRIFPNSTVVENGSSIDSIQALKAGRIDAYFADEPMALHHQKEVEGLRIIDEPVTSSRLGFMLSEDNTELCAEIDGVIEAFRQNGVLEELKQKWVYGKETPTIDAQSSIKDATKVLKVGISPDAAPFAYKSGTQTMGYDVELMYLIAEQLGYGVELSIHDFSSLRDGVVSGRADVAIGCITYTARRAESVLFTQSTYDSEVVAVVLDNSHNGSGFFGFVKDSFESTFIEDDRWKLIVDGLLVTVQLSVLTLIFGTLLGFCFSFMLRSEKKLVAKIASSMASILDGLPLLVILMMLYYIIFAKTSLSAIFIGVIGLSLDFANTVAGIINTGVASVSQGQKDAALTMGYPKWKAFVKIVFPQAAQFAFPQYTGSVIGMVKGTSILGYITVVDLAKAGDLISARTYEAFLPLIVTAAIYYILARAIIAMLEIIAKMINPKRRKRTVRGVAFND